MNQLHTGPLKPPPRRTADEVKQFLKRVVRLTGYDVKRRSPSREDFLASRHIDTIIDVGANIGQFGKEVRAGGFLGHLVSFEPIAHVYKGLADLSAHDPLWTAYNIGLSDEAGTAAINVCRNTTFSSLQNLTDAALRFDRNAECLSQEVIMLRRLDEFDSQIAGERLFLKIDTQGHERQVVAGAGKVLDRIQGIQLELPISAFYQDTWSMPRALDFMRELGFLPTHFYPVNFHCDYDPVALVEVDCIFRRFDARIDG